MYQLSALTLRGAISAWVEIYIYLRQLYLKRAIEATADLLSPHLSIDMSGPGSVYHFAYGTQCAIFVKCRPYFVVPILGVLTASPKLQLQLCLFTSTVRSSEFFL